MKSVFTILAAIGLSAWVAGCSHDRHHREHVEVVVDEPPPPRTVVAREAPPPVVEEVVVESEPAPDVVVVREAPPALIVETRPSPPGAGFIWISGHWGHSHGRYVWVNGSYVRSRPGYTYVSPGWVRGSGGYVPKRGGWVSVNVNKSRSTPAPVRVERRDSRRTTVVKPSGSSRAPSRDSRGREVKPKTKR